MSGAPPDRPRILVVDDDPIVAGSLAEFLRAEGHEVAVASGAEEAIERLGEAEAGSARPDGPAPGFDAAIVDVAMPGRDGFSLLEEMRRRFRSTPVVMLTAYGSIDGAVDALQAGASDYLTKPVIDDELRIALRRALNERSLRRENQALHRRLAERAGLDGIVGADPRMQRIYDLVEAVAPSRTTVLMTGESGTGKSLIAHAIHRRSQRAGRPFVEISCGSIPETLLESELFGHVKGAFTGAYADKVGRFLAADGGTIFLDEINSASPALQLKLLRVLQERRFEPVGSTQTVEVDVRIILASNQPLEQMVAAGTFRQDLYYRINVVSIDLPPLRERVSDIPLLAERFLDRFARELGKPIAGFTPEAIGALSRYAFPGNVRELQNLAERAAVLCRGPLVTIDDLPPGVTSPGAPRAAATGANDDSTPWVPMPLDEALKEPERRILLRALRANNGNRQRTAEQLKINRTTLYKRLKALGLDARAAG